MYRYCLGIISLFTAFPVHLIAMSKVNMRQEQPSQQKQQQQAAFIPTYIPISPINDPLQTAPGSVSISIAKKAKPLSVAEKKAELRAWRKSIFSSEYVEKLEALDRLEEAQALAKFKAMMVARAKQRALMHASYQKLEQSIVLNQVQQTQALLQERHKQQQEALKTLGRIVQACCSASSAPSPAVTERESGDAPAGSPSGAAPMPDGELSVAIAQSSGSSAGVLGVFVLAAYHKLKEFLHNFHIRLTIPHDVTSYVQSNYIPLLVQRYELEEAKEELVVMEQSLAASAGGELPPILKNAEQRKAHVAYLKNECALVDKQTAILIIDELLAAMKSEFIASDVFRACVQELVGHSELINAQWLIHKKAEAQAHGKQLFQQLTQLRQESKNLQARIESGWYFLKFGEFSKPVLAQMKSKCDSDIQVQEKLFEKNVQDQFVLTALLDYVERRFAPEQAGIIEQQLQRPFQPATQSTASPAADKEKAKIVYKKLPLTRILMQPFFGLDYEIDKPAVHEALEAYRLWLEHERSKIAERYHNSVDASQKKQEAVAKKNQERYQELGNITKFYMFDTNDPVAPAARAFCLPPDQHADRVRRIFERAKLDPLSRTSGYTTSQDVIRSDDILSAIDANRQIVPFIRQQLAYYGIDVNAIDLEEQIAQNAEKHACAVLGELLPLLFRSLDQTTGTKDQKREDFIAAALTDPARFMDDIPFTKEAMTYLGLQNCFDALVQQKVQELVKLCTVFSRVHGRLCNMPQNIPEESWETLLTDRVIRLLDYKNSGLCSNLLGKQMAEIDIDINIVRDKLRDELVVGQGDVRKIIEAIIHIASLETVRAHAAACQINALGNRLVYAQILLMTECELEIRRAAWEKNVNIVKNSAAYAAVVGMVVYGFVNGQVQSGRELFDAMKHHSNQPNIVHIDARTSAQFDAMLKNMQALASSSQAALHEAAVPPAQAHGLIAVGKHSAAPSYQQKTLMPSVATLDSVLDKLVPQKQQSGPTPQVLASRQDALFKQLNIGGQNIIKTLQEQLGLRARDPRAYQNVSSVAMQHLPKDNVFTAHNATIFIQGITHQNGEQAVNAYQLSLADKKVIAKGAHNQAASGHEKVGKVFHYKLFESVENGQNVKHYVLTHDYIDCGKNSAIAPLQQGIAFQLSDSDEVIYVPYEQFSAGVERGLHAYLQEHDIAQQRLQQRVYHFLEPLQDTSRHIEIPAASLLPSQPTSLPTTHDHYQAPQAVSPPHVEVPAHQPRQDAQRLHVPVQSNQNSIEHAQAPAMPASDHMIDEQEQVSVKEYVYAGETVQLTGTEAQHQVFGAAYEILNDAHLLQASVPKDTMAERFEAIEDMSFAAIEAARAGDMELAIACTQFAQAFLQQAEWALIKAGLIGLGVVKGGTKGAINVVMAPADSFILALRVSVFVGKNLYGELLSVANDPEGALKRWENNLAEFGRLAFDENSRERKEFNEKTYQFLESLAKELKELPAERYAEFLTEAAVTMFVSPQHLVAKVPKLDKARKALTRSIKAELAGAKALIKAGMAEYSGVKMTHETLLEIERIERQLGKKLDPAELMAEVRKFEQKLFEGSPILASVAHEIETIETVSRRVQKVVADLAQRGISLRPHTATHVERIMHAQLKQIQKLEKYSHAQELAQFLAKEAFTCEELIHLVDKFDHVLDLADIAKNIPGITSKKVFFDFYHMFKADIGISRDGRLFVNGCHEITDNVMSSGLFVAERTNKFNSHSLVEVYNFGLKGCSTSIKTCFPQHWSREKKMMKIMESMKNGVAKPIGMDKIEILGKTSEGIEICSIINRSTGEVSTVFPSIFER